jgi:hypothetical protein
MVEYALDSVRHGLTVAPLWWVTLDSDCACPPTSRTRDNGVCGSPGKHPVESGWQCSATTDEDVIRAVWRRYPLASPGIVLDGSTVVIDVDPRHGGDATLVELQARLGELPMTWAVSTGGGGVHLYHALPDTFENDLISSLPGGIDIKHLGGFVVAPGSLHVSGRRYVWLAGGHPGDGEMAEIPAAWLRAISRPVVVDASAEPMPDSDVPVDERVRRARSCVVKMPIAIAGQDGHGATFDVALAAVRGFVVPRAEALDILREYSARCQPPWSEHELAHKVDDAMRGKLPWGYLLARTDRPADVVSSWERVVVEGLL